MDSRVRVTVGFVIVLVLVGSFVHYGATEEEQWPYTSTDELATTYEDHVGEETFLFGTVLENSETVVRVTVDAAPQSFEMSVRNADVTVEPGGIVQIYGTLQADHVVTAERIIVVNPDGGGDLYKFGVSGVGAVVVLALFFRHWRVDTDAWAFEVREDG